MKQLLILALAAILLTSANANAQTTVRGAVKDADSGNPLAGTVVQIVGTQLSAISDFEGNYVFSNLLAGKYVFTYTSSGYAIKEQAFDVMGEELVLPDALLKRTQAEEGQSATFSEVVISSDDLESDGRGQNVSGLLQSSQDAFNSAVSYTFSPARFRVRGYDSDYSLLYMNGIPVNDPESGFQSWSAWGGLNDVTRNRESRSGIVPADFSFGGLGGASNINVRASQARKGTRISYASTNRTYTNRLMFTHATGLNEKGFALTISGSRRWAEEGYVEGTFYDAWAYFVAAEKKYNEKHSFSFVTFNAPTTRGMQGVGTDEINSFAGTSFYNPNWGYQDGEKRNARVRFQQEPTFILSHFWSIDSDTRLSTSVGYSFGRFSTTALNWYDAEDPRPDYYRKLPSYKSLTASQDIIDDITYAFTNDVNVRQINWNNLYQANYNSWDAINNSLRSKYIIEDRISDSRQLTFSSVLNKDFSANLKFNAGIEASSYKSRNYKTISDLLGGNYWLDIDQFAERDFGSGALAQNDLDNPNRMVKEGDVYGNDYSGTVNNGSSWAVFNYMSNVIDFYAGANLTLTQFWRTGNMRNGRFPNNSKGDSEKQFFANYGVKSGATWKITGRHFVDANATYMTRAPFLRYSYVSPRTSNTVAPGLESERILSGDINYNVRFPFIKARLTAYYTLFMDQNELKSYYDDYNRTFVNLSMTNIDKEHKGIEFGAEIKVSTTLTLNTALAMGSYKYISRPDVIITKDNSGEVIANKLVYMKNFFIPNAPQTAATVGFRYAGPKYWFFGASASYFDDIFIDFNPERRTPEALIGFEEFDPVRELITKQQSVSSQFLVDANVGKSWRYKDYFINLNFQVANVLDNTDFKTGGYEQLRFAGLESDLAKFPPRYFYAYGRSYYLILGLRF
jgi:hypothetical protein